MSAHYCARCLTTFADDPSHCPNLTCGSGRPKPGWGTLLAPGDLLDRHYLIDKVLAVGGAGITYLSREVDGAGQAIAPDLAIKVLYAARDSGPFLRRLANEAQILQELAHDHIVECRGFVHRAGHAPYLVTLFEPGGSLAAHVERAGPLDPTVAGGVLRQVLLALDVAHQRGVVHRDLKPDNVLLAAHVPPLEVPWVRVADFGIAKVFGGVGARLTKLGAFVGTPEYAAPEQFEGMTPSPATDVYAAGALLAYLLTGSPPVDFSHRNDIEQSYDQLLDQIPPQLGQDVGTAEQRAIAQRVLEQTMHPKQGDRWTVQQVLAQLGPLVGDHRPVKPERTQRRDALDAPKPPPGMDRPATPTVPPSEDGGRPAAKAAQEAVGEAQQLEETVWEHSGPTPDATPEPPPQATPPPAAKAAPARRSGSGAGFLGLAGVGAVLAVGGVLVVIGLAGAAWGFGWFATGEPDLSVPAALPPVEVPAAAVLTDASPDQTHAVLAAIGKAASDMALFCKPSTDVPLELVLDSDGGVRSAVADPRAVLKDDAATCVQDSVAKMTLPNDSGHPIRVRLTVPF